MFVEIFKAHVIPNVLCTTVIKNEIAMRDARGVIIKFIRKNTGLYVDGNIKVITANIMGKDGVIHLIDHFRLPDAGK